MKIYAGAEIKGLKLNNTAVCLGGFDAIHIGHRAIIEDVVEYAKKNGRISLVYMFKNSPREVLTGEKVSYINTFEKRIGLMEDLGVDIVVADDFTKAYSEILPQEFVEKYLVKRFGARYVVTGENYRFGKKGMGDNCILKELLKEYSVEVKAIPCVEFRDEVVSSTRIKGEILNGRVDQAEKMLGRSFSISGQVVEGNKIGREMEFPTANMVIPKGGVMPKYGVYITRTEVDGIWYKSITNIGGKPTVEEDAECIETHIMGFNKNIYGKTIEIEFCRFLREIIKFENIGQLKAQLERDKEEMWNFFENRG